MIIDRLIIKKTSPEIEIIRNIEFKKGLNLITDLTKNEEYSSGNNIGKSTLLQIIDLCLGGKDLKNIYFDSDTSSTNELIKSFLENNQVVGELNLKDKNGKIIKIEKQLFGKGAIFFNDEQIKISDYRIKLKKVLFDSSEKNPTFRELIPKFIRLTNLTNDNMLKFSVHNDDDKYDAIYTFLFRLKEDSIVSDILTLNNSLKKVKKNINILKKENNIPSKSFLIQKKEILEEQLKTYENIKKELNFLKTNYSNLEEIRSLISKIDNYESEIELLDLEINLIKENIEEMDKQLFNLDTTFLKKLYNEANIFIDKLEKTFDDLVKFHNIMISNRKKYIESDLIEKENKRKNFVLIRDDLLNKKEELEKKELSGNTFENLLDNSKKYEDLLIEKGKVVNSLEMLEKAENEKFKIEKAILEKESSSNTANIVEFNKIFSEYSKKLYNESFFITYNEDWKKEKVFPVICEGINGQVGTGTKKAIVVAFDLAYLEYSNKVNISCPKFLIHDKLENTHINQIKTIFDISEKIDGQFIVPILKERVQAIYFDILRSCTILELSENDKLFRV